MDGLECALFRREMEKDVVLPVPFVILVFISKEHLLRWKECNSLKVTDVYSFLSKSIDSFLQQLQLSPPSKCAGSFLLHRYALMLARQDPVIQHYETVCVGMGQERGPSCL